MTTMVTGGAGVVGSYLVRELVQRGERPVVVDVQAGPRFQREFEGAIDFVAVDITELSSLIDLCRRHGVRTIVHLAALTGSRAPDRPMEQFRANMEGTMNVLEAARLSGVKRVAMASTRTVYPDFLGPPHGPPDYLPVPEEHWLGPVRPYEVWKHAAERIGEHYRSRFGLEFCAFRFAVYFAAERALQAGLGKLRAMGQLHGLIHHAHFGPAAVLASGADQVLDLVYVGDLVRALLLAVDADTIPSSIYNLGSGAAVAVGRVVETLRVLCPRAELEVGPGGDFAAGQYCVLDISRAGRELGYRPEYSLESGLRDCLARLDLIAR